MNHTLWVRAVGAAIATLASSSGTVLAVNIETVPVGNPGNAADTRYASPGYGSVSYTYNLGKYEVTAGQYCEFLNKVAGTDTHGLYSMEMWSSITGCKIQRSGTSGSYTYNVASDYANRPVNYVSWGDAARFANWLHNGQPTGAQNLNTTEDGAYHLNGATSDAALLAVTREANWKWAVTSEDEWYKAACYNPATSSYYAFPTRSNTAPGRDLGDASGNNANYYAYASGPYPIDSPYYTTVAGEFQDSASPCSTFDQGGNVAEWNEAVLDGSSRGVRGGEFNGDVFGLHVADREERAPTFEFDNIGFRVAQVPEPTSLALLALGGVGGLVRRRGLGR